MPTVATAKLRDAERKYHAVVPQAFHYTVAVVADAVPQNDDIDLLDIPPGYAVMDAKLSHSATLGASATAQLRHGTTALTAATTAGGASTVMQNAMDVPSTSARSLNVLIAGAKINATATISVQGFLVPVQVTALKPLPSLV